MGLFSKSSSMDETALTIYPILVKNPKIVITNKSFHNK